MNIVEVLQELYQRKDALHRHVTLGCAWLGKLNSMTVAASRDAAEEEPVLLHRKEEERAFDDAWGRVDLLLSGSIPEDPVEVLAKTRIQLHKDLLTLLDVLYKGLAYANYLVDRGHAADCTELIVFVECSLRSAVFESQRGLAVDETPTD